MRILLVIPAALGRNAAELGGVAGYVTDLARTLRDLGHTVGAVSSGHTYSPSLLGRGEGRCRSVRRPAVDGIERFEIVNSPVLAPSLWQFGEPAAEIRHRTVEHAFSRVIGAFAPDIVHIHGFEGFCAGIVRVSRAAGARVLVSLHNYHPFCPQVYLMQGRRRVCLDYEGGHACERCESVIDTKAERSRRALSPSVAPPFIAPPPWPPIQTFDADGAPTAETVRLWHNEHPHWLPARATPLPASDQQRPGTNAYAQRRAAFVASLNAADRVIAVSSGVERIAAAMGVQAERLLVQPIGSWAASAGRIQPAANDPAESGQLRLVFLGFNNYYKGLPVLIDAIGLLTPAFRSRIHLAAIGTNCEAAAERVQALLPHLGGSEIGGAYDRTTIAQLLNGRHLGVVPSVWHDNGPQTAIEMRSLGLPVLGSDIGGIPDIIRDGRDGLLFPANDRFALARVLARVLSEQGLLQRLRASIGEWTSLSRHAEELCGCYEAALSCP